MKPLATFAILLLGACAPAPQPDPQPKAAAEPPKPVEYFRVDPATAASVSGTITFRGAKPPKTPIAMDAEAACAKAHAGKPVFDEPVITGRNGGLANAFVYIQTGLEGKNFEPPKEPIVLDQRGCLYVPRVLGIRAGQTLAARNSDPVSHNIHPLPKENREWSEQQSPQSPDLEKRFARPEVVVPVKCDIHKWMRAYIGVVPHPYFVVTSADGSFELRGLPPGDYTVAVWHEKLGERTAPLHLDASGKGTLSFTYELAKGQQ